MVILKTHKKGDVCFDLAQQNCFIMGFILSLLFFSIPVAQAKTPIEINLKQSAQEVWQRQQLIISLEVITDDPFSRLDFEDFSQKGFSIIPFKQQRVETKQQTLLTLQWLVFPFIAGDYQLELPRIRYRPNSGRIQTLDLNTIAIKIKKLPLYVPPTMPVGQISLEQIWANGSFISPNNLHEWQVIVKGIDVAKQTMPPITQNITTTKRLQILPIQSTLKSLQTTKGIINTRTYKIPLKAKQSGRLSLPNIQFQYFDTADSKLKTASLATPFIISLNQWLIGFILLLMLTAVSYTLKFLFIKLKNSREKQKQRKAVMQALEKATNYSQIRQALSQYAQTQGWNKNTSLTTFSNHWQAAHGKSPQLKKAIVHLQKMEFSKNDNDELKEISALLREFIF